MRYEKGYTVYQVSELVETLEKLYRHIHRVAELAATYEELSLFLVNLLSVVWKKNVVSTDTIVSSTLVGGRFLKLRRIIGKDILESYHRGLSMAGTVMLSVEESKGIITEYLRTPVDVFSRGFIRYDDIDVLIYD
jgi:hypothetical protein